MASRDFSNPDGWIPFSERQGSRRNYANHVRVNTFENTTASTDSYQSTTGGEGEMQPCPTCSVMMTFMTPENVWICSSCGYNLNKIAMNNNPNYPPAFASLSQSSKQRQNITIMGVPVIRENAELTGSLTINLSKESILNLIHPTLTSVAFHC
jgi:ribosomal protein L37AE/L43A